MANPSIKEIIHQQYQMCAADPTFFMRQYCYIQHPKRGKIKFNLYDFQEESLKMLETNRYSVILKSRQLGISTLTAGVALWNMLFKEDFNVLVIATTQEVAKNLVTKVRIMHDNLPSWLKGTIEADNKLSLKFKNGSQIKAVSSATTGARSEALSLLIIDEAAFIRNIEEIWIASQATLSTGGGAIVLSTPNGIGNWFHKTWVDSETNPKTQWKPLKLHWTVHPDRDIEWRDEQTQLLGERGAAQECDCDFISSGHTVIDGKILIDYQDKCIDPIEMRGFDNGYWVWEYPDYSKNYIVVADVARGDSADWSAFHVIDVETVTQVAEYKGKIPPKDFGNMLVTVATEWNNALLAIENANIGWAAIQPALDRSYENLFYTYKDDGYVDTEVQLQKGYDMKDKTKMVPGVSTTTRTRPLMISALEMYMRENTPVIRSKRLLQELFVFIWLNGKAQSQQGYNDDLVMSFCIGLWLRDTSLKLRQQGIDLNKQALSQFRKSDNVIYTGKNKPANSGWDWNNGKDEEGLTWLV
jgi:hypothetical protein|tara:strand:- start:5573 stop:7153 length:1581 start_codon:yes stop_codon:yes gene_type:complete